MSPSLVPSKFFLPFALYFSIEKNQMYFHGTFCNFQYTGQWQLSFILMAWSILLYLGDSFKLWWTTLQVNFHCTDQYSCTSIHVKYKPSDPATRTIIHLLMWFRGTMFILGPKNQPTSAWGDWSEAIKVCQKCMHSENKWIYVFLYFLICIDKFVWWIFHLPAMQVSIRWFLECQS